MLGKKYGRSNVERYGSGAFVLNYPNQTDIQNNKTGSGIWIHGIDNEDEIQNKNISKGCVVVENKTLMKINHYINKKINKTIVLIYGKNNYGSPSKILSLFEGVSSIEDN